MDSRTSLGRFGRIVFATGLALIGVGGVGSPSAQAAPSNTSVAAYRLPCDDAFCDDDRRLDEGDLVDGRVQIQARSESTIGLRSVEVQMQSGGEWVCVRRWNTSARNGRWFEDLDFRDPVRACNGSALTDGRNGSYRFRTVATDSAGSDASGATVVQIASPPLPPVWASEPARDGKPSDAPAVALRWYRNPEPDIVEYHFARTGPGGTDVYAVSADHPGGQGCTLEGDIYECTDDDFPARGYDGSYTYALRAYRAAPGGSQCSLPGSGNCIGSSSSSTRRVGLQAPKAETSDGSGSGNGNGTTNPPPPPDSGGSGSNGSSGSSGGPARNRPPSLSDLASGGFNFEGGEYEQELPYGDNPDDPFANFEGNEQAIGDFDSPESEEPFDPSRGLAAIAGGLALIAAAVQVLRILRVPARTGR